MQSAECSLSEGRLDRMPKRVISDCELLSTENICRLFNDFELFLPKKDRSVLPQNHSSLMKKPLEGQLREQWRARILLGR